MITFTYFYLYFMIVAGPVLAWLMWCNDQTFRDRRDIAHGIFHGLDQKHLESRITSFDKVTYNQHMWYRLTLRNPRVLYDRKVFFWEEDNVRSDTSDDQVRRLTQAIDRQRR